MCGIAGYISQDIRPFEGLSLLKTMAKTIAHRGPDGEGIWINEGENVGLAHRRLSIIDLSESANQPMHYMDRYTIIFNGEIYNYIELKQSLIQKGYKFYTKSDTEVLMALFHDAKENCLQKLDGMFAFVIYDDHEKRIFMARDRFGEKPLYYSSNNTGFYFGSEMKALWAAGISKEINQQMLYNYIKYGVVENQYNKRETFYCYVNKLQAAHYLYFSVDATIHEPKKYWDIQIGVNDNISEEKASEKMKELFFTSIQRRLRSDVPLGSSLSGGLDSSLIVCVIDEIDKDKKINRKTFSAQFPGFEKDESRYQKIVIDKCHVDPHFVTPTEESLLMNFQKVAYHQEEPFGSASINIQFEVFELAKKNGVTVLLDGQGADEVFAGYHNYYPSFFSEIKKNSKKNYNYQWNAYKSLHANNNVNIALNKDWKYHIKKLIPKYFHEPAKKLVRPNEIFFLDTQFKNRMYKKYSSTDRFNDLNLHLYFNTIQTGLEILLRYADRNSMAHGREVRLPFLYHELVEFAFSLPSTFKINHGWTKWIVREAFSQLLPKEIAWRRDKIGYEPPHKEWMHSTAVKEITANSVASLINYRVLDKGVKYDQLSDNMKWKALVISNTLFK